MKLAAYTLIDCATGLSYGPFELLDQARDRAEVESIAKWEILNRDGKLVAWSKPDGAWPNPGPKRSSNTRVNLSEKVTLS
jgi:hypothetical protein